MIGVGIVFKWGPPMPDMSDREAITIEGLNHEAIRTRRKHEIMSRIGLGAIFLGFVFQLLSTFA